MKYGDSIREAYSKSVQCYIKMIDDAMVHNKNDYLKLHELSRMNEYAYFVLFWGQFESYINDKALEREGENYKDMDFMPRVRMFIAPKFYTDVDQFYYWRCKLAHGNNLELPELTLPIIFDKIDEIIKQIDKDEDFSDIF